MITVALVVATLIAINALYVAAEFAAVSVRRSRVAQLAGEGNGLARGLLPVVENALNLDRYIATCQIGITISSLVLGAYGQANLAGALTPVFVTFGGFQEVAAQSTAAVIVLVLLTALQVLLGELVPKSLALQFPTQIALATLLPMKWSIFLLRWFIALLNGSGVLLLRLLRVPQVGHRHIHSPEEIALILADSRDGGALDPDEQLRLHRALGLETRTIGQLMVPRNQLASLAASMPIGAAVSYATASPYTRYPVYEGTLDRVIGLLHTKDLVRWYLEHGVNGTVRQLVRPIPSVTDSMSPSGLIQLLREHRSQQALVRDAAGRLVGIVTLEDVLSEVLGDLGDEFKADPAGSSSAEVVNGA